MRRHLHRIGLSLLLTVGVISWSQQQSHSFSHPQPLFFSASPTGQPLLKAIKTANVGVVRMLQSTQP